MCLYPKSETMIELSASSFTDESTVWLVCAFGPEISRMISDWSQDVISIGHSVFTFSKQQLISTFSQQGIPQSFDENRGAVSETAMKAIKPIDMNFFIIRAILLDNRNKFQIILLFGLIP